MKTSADIDPGNIGGASVDLDARVIGIPALADARPEVRACSCRGQAGNADHLGPLTRRPFPEQSSADHAEVMTAGRVSGVVWLRRLTGSTWRRIRTGWRAALTRMLRLTGAAMAAYFVAHWLLGGRFTVSWLTEDRRPLLAPLTALLVVQVTVVQTFGDTLRRIASVVAGVAVAVLFSARFGTSALTLGFLIGASILVGQALRLGPHLLEVPISAMLVLGVNPETAANSRVIETIIGAGIGLLVNVLFPPAVRLRSASAAVEQYAADLAALLERVGDELEHGVGSQQADGWLAQARELSNAVDHVDRLLTEAEQSRRLNPRAVGRPDLGPDVRSGLDALEHSAVVLRALYRSIAEQVRHQPDGEQPYAEEIRGVFAELLRDLARALRSYGALVSAEAEAATHGQLPMEKLTDALEAAGEARARLTELLLMDAREQPELWPLHGALLSAVDRVLQELDSERRAQARQRRLAEHAQTPAAKAVEKVRSATRQVTDIPHRWPR